MRTHWLRSAVGEPEKWSADGETAGTKPERNAAAEPQTEARRSCGTLRMPARDERAVCGVERASSRGIWGDGQTVEHSKPRVGHGGFYRLRCSNVFSSANLNTSLY